jgi:hypothetical protein
MPYLQPPVEGAPELPYQNKGGWDPTVDGEQSASEQSTAEQVYDATPGSGWSAARWRKSVNGGAIDISNGQVNGAGWPSDGTSNASKWKEV